MVSFSWLDNPNGEANDHHSNDHRSSVADPVLSPSQAEEILQGLAAVFGHDNPAGARHISYPPERPDQKSPDDAQFPIWKPDIAPWWSRFLP